MHHVFCYHFFERSVALIEVQVVVFMKVVADVNIRVAIVIQVTRYNAESVADDRADNTGLRCYINKFSLVIAKQFVAREWMQLTFKCFFGAKCPVLMQ